MQKLDHNCFKKGSINIQTLIIIILLVLTALFISLAATRMEDFGGSSFSTLLEFLGGLMQ